MTFSCTAFIALYYFVDEIRILIRCGARQRRKSRCHHSHRTCRNQSRRRRFGRKDGAVGGGSKCDIWVSKYDYGGGKHESRSLITVKGPALNNFGGKIGDGGMAAVVGVAAGNATFGLANTTMVAASTKAALSSQSKDLP